MVYVWRLCEFSLFSMLPYENEFRQNNLRHLELESRGRNVGARQTELEIQMRMQGKQWEHEEGKEGSNLQPRPGGGNRRRWKLRVKNFTSIFWRKYGDHCCLSLYL